MPLGAAYQAGIIGFRRGAGENRREAAGEGR